MGLPMPGSVIAGNTATVAVARASQTGQPHLTCPDGQHTDGAQLVLEHGQARPLVVPGNCASGLDEEGR
ncbi:hypothetical protein B0T44_16205 [Nocardia donostiensis]|uniref:Uncharacterized protein n=1 Tax=Nocardia donostiensis TaxID=1538463 RepID=A0A1V2TAQ5_9NOCA|nr:hypothetical protein B0T46_21920 [Nocardia donostiensis]OQS19024.1 hypothetical protein B0T44_16205 [Nocardia donostiensis]